MLAESYKLDPGLGTLLNLALCHESVGQIATAWGEFRAVEQQTRTTNTTRSAMAREHADALEPRLARVAIVAGGARAPNLTAAIDGEIKPAALWPGIPVDPGKHVVVFRAPGKKPSTLDIVAEGSGLVRTITVPDLEDAPPDPETEVEARRVEQLAAFRTRRATGLVVGGIGAAVAAGGVALGILALVTAGDAKDQCSDPCVERSARADEADKTTDRALLFANVANVAIPLGLVALGIGGYLVLSARAPESGRAGLPSPARSAGGPVTGPTIGIGISGFRGTF